MSVQEQYTLGTSEVSVSIASMTGTIALTTAIEANGADYAEYFVNLDGVPLEPGSIVTLASEGVRLGTSKEDYVLGTIAATAGVIGNDPLFCWQGRYIKDEWGRPIDDAGPVQSSDHDTSKPYVTRKDRPCEYALVSLLGQVYVRVIRDLPSGSYVDALGGLSLVASRIKVMKMTVPFNKDKGYGIAKCLVRRPVA